MGRYGPCVGGQKEEKEEKRRAPSFSPVDLGRRQATSPLWWLDCVTNGLAARAPVLFFLAESTAQLANRDTLAAKETDLFLGHTSCVCMTMAPRARGVAGSVRGVVVQRVCWSVRGGRLLRVLSAKEAWCAHGSRWAGGLLTSGLGRDFCLVRTEQSGPVPGAR